MSPAFLLSALVGIRPAARDYFFMTSLTHFFPRSSQFIKSATNKQHAVRAADTFVLHARHWLSRADLIGYIVVCACRFIVLNFYFGHVGIEMTRWSMLYSDYATVKEK